MNKLVAIFSSVAVCVSAVAVSVLSYFSHPAETEATAPDTSSLVTTPLAATGSYPSITIPKNDLVNATADFSVFVYFCPSGWQSPSTANVSPVSYGSYDSSFYSYCYLKWRVSDKRFIFTFLTHFNSNYSGQKIFSKLYLSNIWGNGGLNSQNIFLSAVSPTDSASTTTYLYVDGVTFEPSALNYDVKFTLKGLIGNDYDLYVSSHAYDEGNADGHNEGYTAGFDEGNDLGYASGYSVGVHDASSQFGMWDLFSNAFTSVGNVLGIQIFPGFTVGLLISVPIAFAFILWLIHVLKG